MADQQAGSPNTREVEYRNSAQTRAWADEHETIDRLFAGLTQIALDHAAPKLGEKGIDIGCGSGTTVLELAAGVGPTGYVVGADVSKPSVEKARERIAAAGVHQAEIMLCDVSTHIFPANSFDLVFSRFGASCLHGPAYDLRQDTQGDEIRRSACLSSFPHATREQVGDSSSCSGPSHVAARHAVGSGRAGPILVGRSSTRPPHPGRCRL